jgi:hypothetical protein
MLHKQPEVNVRYMRFTLGDRMACAHNDDNPNWGAYVRKSLKQMGFDLKKTFLFKKNPALFEEIYCEKEG